jgi:hypothetical protein
MARLWVTIQTFASISEKSQAGEDRTSAKGGIKMSGIGTIFNFDRAPVDAEQLRSLSESLSARGPDGSSSFCSANIGMCFSALHTTRESWFEKQPLVTLHGDVLVMDGILFNRQELIELLNIGSSQSSVPVYKSTARDLSPRLSATSQSSTTTAAQTACCSLEILSASNRCSTAGTQTSYSLRQIWQR